VAVDVLMDSVVAVADSLAVDATVTDIKKYWRLKKLIRIYALVLDLYSKRVNPNYLILIPHHLRKHETQKGKYDKSMTSTWPNAKDTKFLYGFVFLLLLMFS
jgi:hypothetical protein